MRLGFLFGFLLLTVLGVAAEDKVLLRIREDAGTRLLYSLRLDVELTAPENADGSSGSPLGAAPGNITLEAALIVDVLEKTAEGTRMRYQTRVGRATGTGMMAGFADIAASQANESGEVTLNELGRMVGDIPEGQVANFLGGGLPEQAVGPGDRWEDGAGGVAIAEGYEQVVGRRALRVRLEGATDPMWLWLDVERGRVLRLAGIIQTEAMGFVTRMTVFQELVPDPVAVEVDEAFLLRRVEPVPVELVYVLERLDAEGAWQQLPGSAVTRVAPKPDGTLDEVVTSGGSTYPRIIDTRNQILSPEPTEMAPSPSGFVVFPEGPVRVGDRWGYTFEDLWVEAWATGIEQLGGRRAMRIEVAFVEVGASTLTAWVDLENGRMLRAEVRTTLGENQVTTDAFSLVSP